MTERLSPINNSVTDRSQFCVRLPPYINSGEIRVNQEKVDGLCKFAGISSLQVFSVDNGETSRTSPVVIGVDKNGAGLAGKDVARTNVPTYEVKGKNHKSPPFPWPNFEKDPTTFLVDVIQSVMDYRPASMQQIVLKINLNTQEISQRIATDSRWKNGTRSLEAWAHYLNTSVRSGIRDAGIRHLMFDTDWQNSAKAIASNTGAVMSLIQAVEKGIDPIVSVITFFLAGSIIGLAESGYAKLLNGENRFSPFVGPQIDRALVLALATKTATLIKAT